MDDATRQHLTDTLPTSLRRRYPWIEVTGSLPSPDLQRMANHVTAHHSAFDTFQEMLEAKGSYRPSMDMRDPEIAWLADYYDAAQSERGDDRRAYRYGTPVALVANQEHCAAAESAKTAAAIASLTSHQVRTLAAMEPGHTEHMRSKTLNALRAAGLVRYVAPNEAVLTDAGKAAQEGLEAAPVVAPTKRTTLRGPGGLRLVLDPGDPHTPAMVFSTFMAHSATYWTASTQAELMSVVGNEEECLSLTRAQLDWLEEQEDLCAATETAARA